MFSFFFREDVSLMPVKWPIRAVILNDMEMLKLAIENREIVATVSSPNVPIQTSPNILYSLCYIVLASLSFYDNYLCTFLAR